MSAAFPIDGSRDALWMATAVSAPVTESLSGHATADVAIIGAGLTGLNAALSLVEQGVSVAVLEARAIGFGASGRSGGQVNLGLNEGPAALLARFGPEQGQRLIDLVMKTPQSVFDIVRQYDLDCDPVQNGWVQAAASKRIWESQQRVAEDYNRYGDAMSVIDGDTLTEKTGAYGYAGGLSCPVAGSIHPLSYTRELARVAQQSGASIYTDSGVTGIEQTADGWQLSTAGGQLKAGKVLVCTNGYTREGAGKALNGLSRAIVPVRSVLAATEPLSDNIRKSVLPGQVTFVDKRRLILYARYDRDGRLCIGDHGPMRDAFAEADFDNVKKRALSVFPQLANVRWDYLWGGRLGMTKSGLPFMHEIAPGLIAGMAFNGRGIGMGTMMGRELASYALSGDRDNSGFPVTAPEKFAMHAFHGIGVSMSIKWFALMDYLDNVR